MIKSFISELNLDGSRSKVVETDDEGRQTTTEWTYDDLGRLVQEATDSYDNAVDYTTTYTYDLVGNRLSQETDQGSDGSVDESTVYTYDDNDRLITGVSGDETTQYTYDHAQQVGKTVSDNGTVVSETTMEYCNPPHPARG